MTDLPPTAIHGYCPIAGSFLEIIKTGKKQSNKKPRPASARRGSGKFVAASVPYSQLTAKRRLYAVLSLLAISCLLCRNNSISDGVSILGAGEIPSF